MSEGIKRMLAERADRALLDQKRRKGLQRSETRWNRIGTVLFARIDLAAPYIDQGAPADKWPPSKVLKIMYCAAATSDRGEAARDAALVVLDALERARELWRGGYHANPFAEHPALRA